jgi:predicted ester cyclase
MMTSVEETRKVVDRYLHSHDLSAIADDCAFVVAATGQEAKGKKAIDELLDYFYNKAFTAKYKIKDLVVGEGRAVLEADFIGKQNLEFAGIQPSGREVHVPLCVVYDVHNGKIAHANIYFESDAIRIQNSR